SALAWQTIGAFSPTTSTHGQCTADPEGLRRPAPTRTVQGLWAPWAAGGGQGRRAATGFGRHRQPRPDRGGGAGEGRRHLRAPRAVLARPGWPGDRLDEAAAGPAP